MQSDTRDHLANERTFLAYLRTALAFIGFGFVIARFAVFIREYAALAHGVAERSAVSTTMGSAMVCCGIAIAVFGLYRYSAVERGLAGRQPAALSVRAAVVVVALLALFGIALVDALYRA
jgi:putative membrane protein